MTLDKPGKLELYEIRFGNYSVSIVARSEEHAELILQGIQAAIFAGDVGRVTGNRLVGFRDADLDGLLH